VTELNRPELELKIAGDWHLQSLFLQALAERVPQALERFPQDARGDVPVLLTAQLTAVLITLHSSLQHEIVHGHPTRWRGVNRLLAIVPLSLWLPYERYRQTHQQHHIDQRLTDPLDVRKALNRTNHPALLMVDTISGLASLEYEHDAWGIDVSVGGSQKGVMLPPGLLAILADIAGIIFISFGGIPVLKEIGLGGAVWLASILTMVFVFQPIFMSFLPRPRMRERWLSSPGRRPATPSEVYRLRQTRRTGSHSPRPVSSSTGARKAATAA